MTQIITIDSAMPDLEGRPELRTAPEQSVLWQPHWSERRQVVAEDRAHLGRLIAALEPGDYGGITLSGSSGPWAQVKSGGDQGYLIELHPGLRRPARQHILRPGGPDLRDPGRCARLGVGATRAPAGECAVRAPGRAGRQDA